MTAVLLVAHGSADPRAGAATREVTRAVAGRLPGRLVRDAYLDHAGPRPADALRGLRTAGAAAVTLVPLLFTAAYHGTVDIPAAVRDAAVDIPVDVADVLGPVAGVVPPALVAGLRARLATTGAAFDAVVLAAAGTRDPAARASVDLAAGALGASLGVPCVPAYASGPGPRPDAAVAALAGRVAVAAYFLAPGRLYDAAAAGARAAGAVSVAEPLGARPELVDLVLDRLNAVRPALLTAAA